MMQLELSLSLGFQAIHWEMGIKVLKLLRFREFRQLDRDRNQCDCEMFNMPRRGEEDIGSWRRRSRWCGQSAEKVRIESRTFGGIRMGLEDGYKGEEGEWLQRRERTTSHGQTDFLGPKLTFRHQVVNKEWRLLSNWGQCHYLWTDPFLLPHASLIPMSVHLNKGLGPLWL